MGLPYVSDPAISKHLAAFLRQHIHDFERENPTASTTVDAILFNGGVFQPEVLRERVDRRDAPVVRRTKKKKWEPLVLTNPSLDLAVAWGAAYFAWLQHTGGKRIGGGIPRSYYVAIETDTPGRGVHAHSIPVLCVVPRRLQEGEEVHMPEPELELALGQPVLFPLYTSTVRGDDKPGQVLRLPRRVAAATAAAAHDPARRQAGRGEARAGHARGEVYRDRHAGTVLRSKEGNRWRLEFNVRDVLREPTKEDEERRRERAA